MLVLLSHAAHTGTDGEPTASPGGEPSTLGDTPAAGMAQEPPAAPPVAAVLVSTNEDGGALVPPASSATAGWQPGDAGAGGPAAHSLPSTCRPAPCDMHIPGFNDGRHVATVYVCDQLPPEAASRPLSRATGTCRAALPSSSWWLPPASCGQVHQQRCWQRKQCCSRQCRGRIRPAGVLRASSALADVVACGLTSEAVRDRLLAGSNRTYNKLTRHEHWHQKAGMAVALAALPSLAHVCSACTHACRGAQAHGQRSCALLAPNGTCWSVSLARNPRILDVCPLSLF
jgi:hypothetical protein